MSKKPTDPLNTSKEYIYSILAYGAAYQLETDYEGDSVSYKVGQTLDGAGENNDPMIPNPLFEQANAATGNPLIAYVKGNYNSIAMKTQTGGTIYLLAIPSMFVNTGSGSVALSTASATGFYIHGQTNSG